MKLINNLISFHFNLIIFFYRIKLCKHILISFVKKYKNYILIKFIYIYKYIFKIELKLVLLGFVF